MRAKVKIAINTRGYVIAKLHPDAEKKRCLIVITPDRRGHGKCLITVHSEAISVKAYKYFTGSTISESGTRFQVFPFKDLPEGWTVYSISVEGDGEVSIGTDRKGQRITRIFPEQSASIPEACLVGGYFRPVCLPNRDSLIVFVTGHSGTGKHGDWWSLLLLRNGDRVVVAEGWRHHRQFKALRCEGGLVEEPVGGDELADLMAMPFWHCKVGEEEVALS